VPKRIKSCLYEIDEWRRIRALELHRKGWHQNLIAEALDITKFTVSRWLRISREKGKRSLRSHKRVGAPCKLTQDQKLMITELLWHGAEAYGFQGKVWTCARVGNVIKREFGIQYSTAHISKILDDLEWSPQTPIVRAAQRNEDDINAWRTDVWPELKKSPPRPKNPNFAG
jgi:transposase